MHVLCGLRLAARSLHSCGRFSAPVAPARGAAEGRLNLSEGGSPPLAKRASVQWQIHCWAVALDFSTHSALGLVLWSIWS